MNAKATVAAIAIKIVMVNAEAKRGEKVFNAYMLSSIRFNCCCCCCCCCWLGSAVLFLLFCCQVSRMGVIASSRYGCTIRTQNKGVKFFFKFFFVGCGRVGVGAWVWVGRCGRVGVGRQVGARGCGSAGGGGGMGAAGWGWAGAGCGRLDWDCRCRMGANRLVPLHQPEFGLPARV